MSKQQNDPVGLLLQEYKRFYEEAAPISESDAERFAKAIAIHEQEMRVIAEVNADNYTRAIYELSKLYEMKKALAGKK